MKIWFLLVSFFWAVPQGFAQLHLTQFEQIESLQIIEKRNVIVIIHTDWCKYCKVMQDKTFKNEEVIKLINNKFYFIDFDAEEQREIVYNNATFKYKPSGSSSGVHELAIELGTINNQINYPTFCILNDKNEIVFQYNSFLNAKDLMGILEKF
jgi:thioredoxin-related protein